MYTYIPSVLEFLSIYVTTERVEFPVLYKRSSLVIYFIHSSVDTLFLTLFWLATAVSQG